MKSLETQPNEKIFRYYPYKPGKPVEEVAEEYGLDPSSILKLASNENLLGSSPLAREAILRQIEKIHFYPDTLCRELRKKIGEQISTPMEQIYIGNGAVEILFNLAHIYLQKGDHVIMGKPSFGAFYIGCLSHDAEVSLVPLKEFRMDTEAMLSEIKKETKLIYLVNPNNPTGTLTPKEDIQDFLSKVPPEILVIIDEAYWVFAEAFGYENGLRYLNQGKNVLIIRSLSKHLGLAGLRVGYSVGRKAVIDNLFQVHLPFHVNSLAQAGAAAGINDQEFINKTLDMLKISRDYFQIEAQNRGLIMAPSVTNFIFLETQCDDLKLARELEKRGVIVRPGSTFHSPGFIRVTIGPKPMMEIFFQKFDEGRKAQFQ